MSFNYTVADIREPQKRKQSFTKTISIPSSKDNDVFFTHIFEVNRSGGFNPKVKAECIVLLDSFQQFKGSAQLKSITQLDHDGYVYNIVIFGELMDLFQSIGKDKLEDLDLSRFNHDWTQTNESDSWATQIQENAAPVAFALGNGYVYPLIDYGYSLNQQDYAVTELFPAVYTKTIVDEIFEAAGFTYTSTFFDSTYFKSLIVPFSRNRLELSSAQINDRLFQASTGAAFGFEHQLDTIDDIDLVEFDDDSTGSNFDNGANFDVATFKYTVPDTGYYDFIGTIRWGLRMLVDYGVATPEDVTAVLTQMSLQAWLFVNGVSQTSMTSVSVNPSNVPQFTTSSQSAASVANPDPDSVWVGSQSSSSNESIVSFSNVLLTAGDEVDVRIRVNGAASQIATAGTSLFESVASPGTFYDGDYFIQVREDSTFRSGVNNIAVTEGGEIDMNTVLPVNVTQADFLSSLVKMFNLYTEQDRTNPSNYLIEPRDDFYAAGANQDWDDKLDYLSEQIILPMGALDAGTYLYTYKPDKDHFNARYEERWAEVYGQHEEDIDNDFIKSVRKTEVIFSPTPIADDGGQSSRVIPRILTEDNTGNIKPYAANIRILYYGGLIAATGNQWNHTSTIDPTVSDFDYPYSGHLDHPFSPTEDINFGVVKEVFYDNLFSPIVWTNNNLFNKYYKKFIEEITSNESIIFEGSFYLTPKDIADLDFRDQYFFKEAYWRLNRIKDYNPINTQLTVCEFIKIKDAEVFSADTATIIGAADDDVVIVVPGLRRSQNFNRNFSTQRDHDICGSDNFVDATARCVEIQGDNNNVHGLAENISIVNGEGNTIESGVVDVTLINSDNLTITESNVTYIDGVKIGAHNIADRDIITVTTSTVLTTDTRTVLCDTSGGDIDIILPSASSADEYRFTIKKIDQANKITVSVSGGATIDDAASQVIKQKYDSMEVESDGTQYNIV